MKRVRKIVLGLIIIAAILTVLILYFRPTNQILVYSVPLCNTLMEKTIKTLVQSDFPNSWKEFFTSKVAEVIAINDLRCKPTGNEADIAIILEDGQKTLFGIFFIRFSRDGEFYATPIVSWKQVPDRNDPQIDAEWKKWKNFIKKVYPERIKKPDEPRVFKISAFRELYYISQQNFHDRGNFVDLCLNNRPPHHLSILFNPPIYFCKASGIFTEPSFC